MSTRRAMIPRSVQAKVVETYGSTCWLKFPGCTGRADTLDHLMPYSKGGTDSVNNLRPACRHCNSLRADRLVQGRGIEVHVLLCAPRVRPHGGMPVTATWLNYDAMLGMLASGRGVDDDVWRIAEGMWNGAWPRRCACRPQSRWCCCLLRVWRWSGGGSGCAWGTTCRWTPRTRPRNCVATWN